MPKDPQQQFDEGLITQEELAQARRQSWGASAYVAAYRRTYGGQAPAPPQDWMAGALAARKSNGQS